MKNKGHGGKKEQIKWKDICVNNKHLAKYYLFFTIVNNFNFSSLIFF